MRYVMDVVALEPHCVGIGEPVAYRLVTVTAVSQVMELIADDFCVHDAGMREGIGRRPVWPPVVLVDAMGVHVAYLGTLYPEAGGDGLGASAHALIEVDAAVGITDAQVAQLISGRPASDWIASVPEAEIAEVLREYGDERYARRIAKRIVEVRALGQIETTGALREIVHRAVPHSYFDGPIDPATRTFQAVRILVNDELESLRRGLAAGFDALAADGVILVISFHSLEDRIVKGFFREKAASCICPPDLPECLCGKEVEAEILTRKPIVPGAVEIAENPRARSAKMRSAKKTAWIGAQSSGRRATAVRPLDDGSSYAAAR